MLSPQFRSTTYNEEHTLYIGVKSGPAWERASIAFRINGLWFDWWWGDPATEERPSIPFDDLNTTSQVIGWRQSGGAGECSWEWAIKEESAVPQDTDWHAVAWSGSGLPFKAITTSPSFVGHMKRSRYLVTVYDHYLSLRLTCGPERFGSYPRQYYVEQASEGLQVKAEWVDEDEFVGPRIAVGQMHSTSAKFHVDATGGGGEYTYEWAYRHMVDGVGSPGEYHELTVDEKGDVAFTTITKSEYFTNEMKEVDVERSFQIKAISADGEQNDDTILRYSCKRLGAGAIAGIVIAAVVVVGVVVFLVVWFVVLKKTPCTDENEPKPLHGSLSGATP
jgi:hypothetical protein